MIIQDQGHAGGAFDLASPHGALHPAVAPTPGDWLVVKRASSAFTGTDLADRLRSAGVDAITVGGLHSEHCVAATCEEALSMDFSVALLHDGHAAAKPEGEQATNLRLAALGVQICDQWTSIRT